MTQRRNDPDAVSNYFDHLMDGLGHRGSSFADIDSVSHDDRPSLVATHDGGPRDRFLIQEFKRQGEKPSRGQSRLLRALVKIQGFTVWHIIKRDDGYIGFYDYRSEKGVPIEKISEGEYQTRVASWWNRRATESRPVSAQAMQDLGRDVFGITYDDSGQAESG
jgi:hypothetical protein